MCTMNDKDLVTEGIHENDSMDQYVASLDELRVIGDLTIELTKIKQSKCEQLVVDNFAGNLFARLLYELSMHKKGLITAERSG